ncbi:TIGR04222 domain-containing membrane protein, partial [Yinghuangia sp. YIM S10712]|uniref:TIGR04222 domain-containing membrane protein n=1 Tax=Yinghuangia sp. YIM S10712 TaxID=3436930 RepID=UPI003F532F65
HPPPPPPPPPPPVEDLDLYQAAFLAGGPARVADVALLAMRAAGVVHIGRDGTVTATARGPADPVAAGVLRAVAEADGSAALSTVRFRGARSREVQAIGDRFLAQGLIRRPGGARKRRQARVILIVSAVVSAVTAVVPGIAPSVGDDGFAVAVAVHAIGFTASLALLQVLAMGRTEHARAGMAYVLRLRRTPRLRENLDRTAAGGAGLGVIAVMGLDRLTDLELLDVFRRERVTQHASGADAGCGGTGSADSDSPSWFGSTSCADNGFRGSSCSGPNCSSSAWSCAASSSSSCSSSSCSSGSSCGGGGGS